MKPIHCAFGGLVLLGLAGCPGDMSGGAEDMAGGGGPDGGGEPEEVSGTAIDTYVTLRGEETRRRDLRPIDVTALVPMAGGGFTSIRGTKQSDGTFVVPGVPVGTYYLKFGNNYIVTSARKLDLGQTFLGRPDRARPTAPTALTFSVDRMAAWQARDNLALFAPNVGGVDLFTDVFATGGKPGVGATSLRLVVDWARARDPYLIDETKGDRLHMLHLQGKVSDRGTAYQGLGEVFDAPPFTVDSGGAATLTGQFRTLAQDRRTRVVWRRSQFESLRQGVSPQAQSDSHGLQLFAYPKAAAYGDYGAGALLGGIYPAPAADDLDAGEIQYGNPFPVDWTVVVSAGVVFRVGYQLPGTMAGAALGAVTVVAEQGQAANLAPLVGPVAQPKVDGRDAFGRVDGVGLTPTLSWSPPQRGQATAYNVFIYRLFDNNGITGRTLVATLRTTDTSVVVPPNVLERNRTFTATIQAVHRPGGDGRTGPFRRALPEGTAAALLGTFTP